MKKAKAKPLHRWIKTREYEFRTQKLRKVIAFMIIGGILLSLAYGSKCVYQDYASSKAKAELYYPEIANGSYPDNSRFTYYDFIDVERIDAALKIMQSRGKYLNFTAEQLQDNFHVYSALDSSVSDAVAKERSAGNDYSYVANKYTIVFYQPHDYSNPDLLSRFLPNDDSAEFLQILMDVNNDYFVKRFGGNAGFAAVTDPGDLSAYDYGEKIAVYRSRIKAINSNLNNIKGDNDKFTYEGMSIDDLIGKYKILNNKLNTIENFVESSGLTKDKEVAMNKLNVNLELTNLRFNKSADLVNINSYAQNTYDHTFTENIIVVALDHTDGLYQARPKTAFDTVVEQKHDAMENKAEYNSEIKDINDTLYSYTTIELAPEERDRLVLRCEELQAEFDAEYAALSETAVEMVGEFYDDTNKGFMGYKVEHRQVIDQKLITKMAIFFVIGAVGVFVLYVLATSNKERRLRKKKTKIIKELRDKSA